MAALSWQNWGTGFGLAAWPTKRRVRDGRHSAMACEYLEERALLSAASAIGPQACEVTHAHVGKNAKAGAIPNIAGAWTLSGEAQSLAFTNAALNITQTGKNISGTATYTGGSIQLTGKVRPNGHITGKATVVIGQQTITKQRYFADLTDDHLTFSGEVNLKALDDLINIDGVHQM